MPPLSPVIRPAALADVPAIVLDVTDREALRPVRVGLEVAAALMRLYPRDYKIDPGDRLFGSRTELAAGLLVAPGKMAIGPDNAIYVTVNAATAGTGQGLRIAQ